MKMIHKLKKIDWADIPNLKSDRKTDRFIAENVLRYHWCTHLPTGRPLRHWRNGEGIVRWGSFRPSKNLMLTLEVIKDFVDKYAWSTDEYIKIETNIRQGKHWNVRALKITYDREEELFNNTEENLALSLCRAMLASYLAYGPKDYSNNWEFEWEGPDTWPPSCRVN